MEACQALGQTPGEHEQGIVASLRLQFHICKLWDNTTYVACSATAQL